MAYKKDYKMSGMEYGYKQGNMDAKVDDYAKPEACYSQKYDQTPLNYIERNNYTQKHESMKLKGESHMGRYDK